MHRLPDCSVARYRALYADVGGRWHWVDRLVWSDEQIELHLLRPEVSIWILSVDGEDAGYAEIVRRDEQIVEIAYFGLMAHVHGRGLGKAFLTRVAQEAWTMGAERVVLDTCTLDSPRALPNYLARGFRVVREQPYQVQIDDVGAPGAE
jgi:GNAT superfamily N-acetyltransferase